MTVTLALLARYAETEPDGGLLNIIGGGTDVFGAAELPVEFSMPCAYHAPGWEGVFYIAGVIGLYAEQQGGHSIGIRLDGIEAGVIPFQIISPDQLPDDVDA